jgi:anti-sigma regulatory factor (Ser/Thr protein kinase)
VATVSPSTWVAVDEAASVPTARRRASSLATSLGFGPDLRGEVEIIASELATNLVKHGGGGDLVLRTTDRGAVQLVAIDSGPGTRDLAGLVRDGISTTGTLGVGLGAVQRLATRVDLWSEPARGAVVVAEVGGTPGPRTQVGHLVRPLRGEIVCGDSLAWRETAGGWLLVVADGLGHGPSAAEASRRAVQVLESSRAESPGELVALMHRATAGTRGAAVAVSRVDLGRGVLTHAAVGNISGRLIEGAPRSRSLASQAGIVGHKLPRVRETDYVLDGARLVVLHSDGLTEKWADTSVPRVDEHGPEVCAAALLRDAGTHRDDASVLTLQLGAG